MFSEACLAYTEEWDKTVELRSDSGAESDDEPNLII